MKKNYNQDDIHQQEGQEQSRKFYRSISDSARCLDDARSCAQNVGDLFTPKLHIQRRKFREYCERLIFSDPVRLGRKVEELLWRKAYYDVVSTAKKLKKHEYSVSEATNIQTHINAGIGYYHHFISRLQSEYDLDLSQVVDFSIICGNADISSLKDLKSVDWAKQSVHRCLIYLGDLSRYKLEIYPNWDPGLAIRYYLQAIYYRPEYGMPHNQMGTLVSNSTYSLDAAYHYIRCLSCKFVFDGTENNLHRLFEKNSQTLLEFPNENPNADCLIQPDPVDHIKRLIVRFLHLVDGWFCGKNVSEVYCLCHQTNLDLQECLSYSKQISSESGDTQTDLDSVDTDSVSSPAYLNHDTLFKVSVICLLCIHKLQKLQSQQISTVIAFTLAIYSQFIQNVTAYVQDCVLNFPLPAVVSVQNNNSAHKNGIVKCDSKKKKVFRKTKSKCRRRTKKQSSDEDSENSDLDTAADIESNSDVSLDGSDNEISSSSSNNESEDNTETIKPEAVKPCENNKPKTDIVEDNETDKNNITAESVKKAKLIYPIDMLEIIGEAKLLPNIKIMNDWLVSDVDVLKSCGKNTRSLLKQIVQLINLINIDLSSLHLQNKINIDVQAAIIDKKKIALPEDVILKDAEILSSTQKDIDWTYFKNNCLNPKEETVIRIAKLVSFGHFLTSIEETGVKYDTESNLFFVQIDNEMQEDTNGLLPAQINDLEISDTNSNEEKNLELNKEVESKGQLMKMKHMGQLWLAAEVRALESRVKGKTSLSPYLVLDADALIKYTAIVKHLVNSRKFIVVVPSAVVSALDDLKREKPEARDAIRWLESQFHQGNRFFRAQRQQERAPLPLIKYPKKKDKEMFIYIQIIECCHYLAQQQKGAANVVTLLLGNQKLLSNLDNREISYIGLAHSAGINLEPIVDFYGKWKKPYKGKR